MTLTYNIHSIMPALLTYHGESSITIQSTDTYGVHCKTSQDEFNGHCRSILGNSYLININLTYPIVGKFYEIGVLDNKTHTYYLGCTETHDFYFLKLYPYKRLPNEFLLYDNAYFIVPKTLLGYWMYYEFINRMFTAI